MSLLDLFDVALMLQCIILSETLEQKSYGNTLELCCVVPFGSSVLGASCAPTLFLFPPRTDTPVFSTPRHTLCLCDTLFCLTLAVWRRQRSIPQLKQDVCDVSETKDPECDVTIVCVLFFIVMCVLVYDRLFPVKSRDQNRVGIHQCFLCFSFGYAE